MPKRCSQFVSIPLAFLLLMLGRHASAAGEPAFTAFASKGGEVYVSHAGEDFLRFGPGAWGPKWAWTGIGGTPKNEQGQAVARLAAKLGGTGVPIQIAFRAGRPEPKKLQLSYELKADADTDLTLAMVELAPGKIFEGRDVVVEAAGQQTRVRFPLDKRGLGEQVSALRLTDPGGRETIIRLDPPIEVASDGSARIVLAQNKLPGGEVRRLTVTVELPDEVTWYPTLAEMPDEPGLDQWYVWKGTGEDAGSVMSMRDWLETPAGKHGRIERKGDQLIYNGKPIKLWGLNLCYGACAPEKALADQRAAFYRKHGINTVRLHKFADGAGWAGIQSKESAVEYDPAGLDRMDYQVAKLKEAGIYVKLSAHFGSLKLGPADKQYVPFMEELGAMKGGRIETPHSAVHYSPELQRVQAMQIVNLLKHKNPHTGLTYAEDPAVAFIEIINEQSILFYSSMNPLKASATLRKQVGERFGAWLRKKYGTHEKLAAAWANAFDCFSEIKTDGEHLDKNNILPLGNPWYWDPVQLAGSQKPKRQRLLDTLEFLYTLQCEFYDGYVKAIREAGYKGELVSSNWQAGRAYSHFANLHSDSRVGTIDRHNYFGERKVNASMLARAGSGMLSSGMQQVAGHPFMLSEWIHVVPNELGLEGPAILGAYGMGLQGWDVSYMFQNRDNGSFTPKIGGDRWEVTAPQVLGVFPAISRQVHRGDVKESDLVAPRNVHVPSLFEGKLSFDDSVAQGYDDKELDSSKVSARSLAVAKNVVAFTDQYTDTPVLDLKPYQQDGQLISSTKQLRWQESDGKSGGFFTMDTPGTKAVVGFAEGRKLALGGVTIEPRSRFGAVYVTARELDKTIDTSRELLVIAIGRSRNTGAKLSPAGDKLLAPGAGPILMEPVKAKITLGKSGATVTALDHDGKPTDKTVPVVGGTIDIDPARDKTPYYLIRY